MKNEVERRWLILETSGRVGQVALASGETVLRARSLDETRRHARDLAPAVGELLRAENWKAGEVQGVIVGRGPGSYTGLRVGIMAAKVFAYATGATLIAVDTFAAIAAQAPDEVTRIDILADAQQEKVYVQRFARAGPGLAMEPATPLTIRTFAEWFTSRDPEAWISGPGLRAHGGKLPAGSQLIAAERWDPRPESSLRIGITRYRQGQHDDPWSLEPLYLRPSAAEEKWQRQETEGAPG